jgi:hypothetical protein
MCGKSCGLLFFCYFGKQRTGHFMRKLTILFLLCSLTVIGQNDSLKKINNFFFELSVGAGHYNEVAFNENNGYPQYYRTEFSSIVQTKLFYRTDRLKTGLNFGVQNYFPPSVSAEIGINFISDEMKRHYFGPSLGCGVFFLNKNYYSDRFLRFGFDYFYKKFHLGIYSQWISYTSNQISKDFYTIHLYLEVGYAFNLESFKRKQN